MRLRQIALVASDLAPVVDELCAAFGLGVAYRDPGVARFGLENAVMPVGDAFLEVVSPLHEGTTAGRYLERRGGDAGYMVILQVPDLSSARARVEQHGVRVVWEGSVPGITGMHLHPADLGGAIVSLDQADPPEDWPWAGPQWADHVHDDVVGGIAAVEIAALEPERMARRWSAVLGVMAAEGAAGVWGIGLDQGVVRFSPAGSAGGEGILAVDLKAADRTSVGDGPRIGGVQFRLV